MLEALKAARSKTEEKPTAPFSMVLVGQGYAERELKELANKLGIADIVHFLGVVRDREVIKQLFARSDLFLFPSLYDTSPLTLREAAAFHLPTLLIKGASATEGISDGENGFIAPDEAVGYGAAIRRVLSNPSLLAKVGQGAFDTLFRTWEQVADEVHGRYLELIERKRSQT
jgi:1,2-diacylglycerol 3-alpha-glucosyltransferase